MALIIGIGIATLDIINTTDGYPGEDAEVRALSQSIRRGGNVTNTLTVLSQLGHRCQWAGTLGDDFSTGIIKSDLQRQQIDFRRSTVISAGRAPTSCITLNKNNGSRTIVHFRDLPEYSFEHFFETFFKDPNADAYGCT
jgi:ketohexokinase